MKKSVRYPIHQKTRVIFYDRVKHSLFSVLNKDLWRCLLCRKHFRAANSHLTRIHLISAREYKKQFRILFGDGLTSKGTKRKLSLITSRTPVATIQKNIQRLLSAPRPENAHQDRIDESYNSLRATLKKKREGHERALIALLCAKYDELKRQPHKSDFTKKEYNSIFSVCGSLTRACQKAGLQ